MITVSKDQLESIVNNKLIEALSSIEGISVSLLDELISDLDNAKQLLSIMEEKGLDTITVVPEGVTP